jgi:hypothetical protein
MTQATLEISASMPPTPHLAPEDMARLTNLLHRLYSIQDENENIAPDTPHPQTMSRYIELPEVLGLSDIHTAAHEIGVSRAEVRGDGFTYMEGNTSYAESNETHRQYINFDDGRRIIVTTRYDNGTISMLTTATCFGSRSSITTLFFNDERTITETHQINTSTPNETIPGDCDILRQSLSTWISGQCKNSKYPDFDSDFGPDCEGALLGTPPIFYDDSVASAA